MLRLSGRGCKPAWAVIIGPDRRAGPAGSRRRWGRRLFGPIEVAAGERRLGPRDLGGPKATQVLELLLVARGHNVTKDRLADQLWREFVSPASPACAAPTTSWSPSLPR